jgi:hypothetical protein
MSEPNKLERSLNERFDRERYIITLDKESDPEELRKFAKCFLELWLQQKAAARWALTEAISAPPRFTSLIPSPESLEIIQQEDA